MKLALHGWKMGQDRDLATMVDLCAETGMAGFEVMEHEDFKSQIPLDSTPQERAEIRRLFEEKGVAIVGLAITCRYHYQDKAVVRDNIETTKKYVELARDVGAPRLRCLGDRLNEADGEPKEKTISRVAGALREICEFADPLGIDCPMEMHSDFSDWEVALAVVEQVKHPRCYLVHNGTSRNTPEDRWDEVWEKLAPYVKHVHVHDMLSTEFPNKRFFRTLRDSGYDGFVSFELQPSDDPVRVLGLTIALVSEWLL